MSTVLAFALVSLLPLASPFRVDSRVLVAVEDGPVIIEATLTYIGREAILVDADCYDAPFTTVPPTKWGGWLVRRPRARIFIGQTVRMLQPGDKLVRIVSPTAKVFCRPRRGECSVEIHGRLTFAAPIAGGSRLLPPPRHVQVVTVQPQTVNTEPALLKLVDDTVNRINSGNLDPHELLYQTRLLENIVLGSQGEFARVVAAHALRAKTAAAIEADVVRLAGYPAEISTRRREALFAYLASAHPQLVAHFLDTLSVGDRAAKTRATRWFYARLFLVTDLKTGRWMREPFDFTMRLLGLILPSPPLSDDNVGRFAEFAASHGPELAVLVYAQFRSRLTAKSKSQLELAITRGISAKSTATVARSLSELDADDFETRERASDTITQNLADGMTYDLAIAEQNRPDVSPEVRHRLAAILRHPRATNIATLRAEVLDQIRTGDLSADVDTLKLLAGGDRETPLVKAARARLQDLRSALEK